MGLSDIITFAQRNFGRDVPPPAGRWDSAPSWLPVASRQNASASPADATREMSVDDGLVIAIDPADNLGVADLADDEIADESPRPTSDEIGRFGTDALAFYLPFHFYRNTWGIYVRESGIRFLANIIRSADALHDKPTRLSLAYRVLYQHEMFHHLCELVASLGETTWLEDVYSAYFSGHGCAELEEAMANASIFRSGLNRRLGDATTCLKAWMRGLGPGYRDFGNYATKSSFQRGQIAISDRMFKAVANDSTTIHHQTAHALAASPDWPGHVLFSAVGSQKPRNVLRHRTYIVMDCHPRCLSVIKPFPKFKGVRVEVYMRDHKPEHIHVFIPPDRSTYLTRYIWPDLRPYNGDYPLSRKERHMLDNYLDKFRHRIDRKIEQVPWQGS